MKDPLNITIGILSVTAALLVTAILLIGSPEQAQADTAQSRGGDYIMVSGEVTNAAGLVYVIDVSAQRLLAYRSDRNRSDIIPVPGTDRSLADLVRQFKAATTPAPPRR